MKKITLKNGLRIMYKKTKGEIVTVNVSVAVGSNNESSKILGISHFMEHMMFEGTKKRTAKEISTEIEKYGGEMNAYTMNEKTGYYIKIHKKYCSNAIEILADMLINSTFDDKVMEKEKNVVLEEISMTNDEPRQYQWVVFNKELFSGQYSNPVYGTKECVGGLKREDMVEYHKRNYTPANIIVTVVGDCDNCARIIKSFFKFKNENSPINRPFFDGENIRKDKVIKKYKSNQYYMIMGYKTPNRRSYDSYVLDIITALLSKGQSGRLFDEIRTKRGLTYDVGTYHHPSKSYGFFAFYSSANKEKLKQIEEIYLKQLEEIKKVSKHELDEAKSYIEGNIAIRMEDSQYQAELISVFEECSSYKDLNMYVQKIKKVTSEDIKRVVERYLNEKRLKIIVC